MGGARWLHHYNFHFIAIFISITTHLLINRGKVGNKVPASKMRDRDTHRLSWLSFSIAVGS
jgi:hypothetical protein